MNKHIVGFNESINENINENEKLFRSLEYCVKYYNEDSYECLKDFENEHIEFMNELRNDERKVGELFTAAYRNNDTGFIRYFIEHEYIRFDHKHWHIIFSQLFRNMVNYYLNKKLYNELVVIFNIIDSKYSISKILTNLDNDNLHTLFNILDNISKDDSNGEKKMLQYLIDRDANMIYENFLHSRFLDNICMHLKFDLLYIIFDMNNISRSGIRYKKFYSDVIRNMINIFALRKNDLSDGELVSIISGIMNKFGITKEMIFKNISYIDALFYTINYFISNRYFKLFTFYFSENDDDLKYIDTTIIKFINSKNYRYFIDDNFGNENIHMLFDIFNDNLMPDDLYVKLFRKVVMNKNCFALFVDLEIYPSEDERLNDTFEDIVGVSSQKDIEIIKNMLL
jgi:hypothetical protein